MDKIDTPKGTILLGDCKETLKTLPNDSIDIIITSPPYYGLRDYDNNSQVGLEQSPKEYIDNLVSIFTECNRILKDSGTLWLNIGDSYAGSGKGRNADGTFNDKNPSKNSTNKGSTIGKLFKDNSGLPPKNLIGIPWQLAFALRDNGWILRQDIIWYKPNAMPESVKDRCTKAHEYIFLFSKKTNYYFNYEGLQEITKNNETRNKRSVWEVNNKPYKASHFATYPTALIEPCIKAGCPINGTVLDPFFGSGTTGEVAQKLGRTWIGCELNPEYAKIAEERLKGEPLYELY
jgi:DNA modification methylase